MKYRTIGTDPATRREVSVLSLGAMLMGSRTDEATSFAILDRYVEAGGTFIDTSGNYAYWINGTQGGESEELLGRWRRSRGVGDEIVIATKVGARPLVPSTGVVTPTGGLGALEGLGAKTIRESAERSMSRLGVSRLDLLYAHVGDPSVAAAETVEGSRSWRFRIWWGCSG
jgi:aryl-alcohol dehydrogenase-like predicted oxidoreductase